MSFFSTDIHKISLSLCMFVGFFFVRSQSHFSPSHLFIFIYILKKAYEFLKNKTNKAHARKRKMVQQVWISLEKTDSGMVFSHIYAYVLAIKISFWFFAGSFALPWGVFIFLNINGVIPLDLTIWTNASTGHLRLGKSKRLKAILTRQSASYWRIRGVVGQKELIFFFRR